MDYEKKWWREASEEIERLKPDAERYKFLRRKSWVFSDEIFDLMPSWGPHTEYKTWQSAVDAAIDEAMRQEK